MPDLGSAAPWATAGVGLGAILAAGALLWLVSLRLRDASIADPFWAPGFLVIGLTYAWSLGDVTPRGAAALGLVGAWAARLGWHLLRRNRREGEDRRYRAMRDRHGEAFWWVSLFTVFWLQGVLLWVVSLPLLNALSAGGGMGPVAWMGGAIALSGIVVEALADAQLRAFRSRRTSDGEVLDTGLWRYSRHPNYFGNAVMWWGLFLLGAGGGGAWTAVSPVVMTFLLTRVSGVALLERDIADRRPAYARYVATTSAFIPWPPRGE